MEAISEFDQHHANIVHHGQDHLAHVLGLAFFAAGKINPVDLGDALHNVGHLFAELATHIFIGNRSVFDGIVQQARCNGRGIQLHVR